MESQPVELDRQVGVLQPVHNGTEPIQARAGSLYFYGYMYAFQIWEPRSLSDYDVLILSRDIFRVPINSQVSGNH